ncbi:helix-turn-helix domain-containing protein [Christiangramia oceanisediminis]
MIKKIFVEIERGEANPSFEKLITLAIVLEVSFKELFNYD